MVVVIFFLIKAEGQASLYGASLGSNNYDLHLLLPCQLSWSRVIDTPTAPAAPASPPWQESSPTLPPKTFPHLLRKPRILIQPISGKVLLFRLAVGI